MLSPNSCSSADIPRQILMNELPALPDLELFVTHIYDVTKVNKILFYLNLNLFLFIF